MTPERWQEVRRLFIAALEMEPPKRRQFLDHAGADEFVKSEVQSLFDGLGASQLETESVRKVVKASLDLDESERSTLLAGAYVGQPELREQVENLVRSVDRAFKLLPVETHIGAYRIERELGRGGMGEVYLGVRDDSEFKRRVAIKVILRGLDTAGVVRRFRNERQLLASLDHPHIAKLHDGGATTDGRPYFVMEFIDGMRLDKFCDFHKLTITKRLELFLKICSAVQHAHHHLIVHRDLKPANILVTAEGDPKLLDFGIAKVLNPELISSTIEPTLLERAPWTPSYASPEQARGGPVANTSDVYSLGVILYELLSGRLPYELPPGLDRQRQAEVISEAKPALLSQAIRRTEGGSPEAEGPRRESDPDDVSNARGTTPERLKRQLAGDLDAIVLKALQKEPIKRYNSVDQFSHDIRRHLRGLPVIARTPSLIYRTIDVLTGGTGDRDERSITLLGRRLVLLAVAGLIGATTSLLLVRPERSATYQQPARFTIDLPEIKVERGGGDQVTISRSGDVAVIAANNGTDRFLYVRRLDDLELRAIPDSDAGIHPRVSDNGQELLYWDEAGGVIKRSSLTAGDPVVVSHAPRAKGLTWGPDHSVIWGTDSEGLMQWKPSLPAPMPLTSLEEGQTAHAWPDSLPDGQLVLFTVMRGPLLEDARLAVLSLETGHWRMLLDEEGFNGRLLASGYIVYVRGTTLMLASFDHEKLEISAPPIRTGERVAVNSLGAAHFSVSANGSLILIPDDSQYENRSMVWVDRRGEISSRLTDESRGFSYPHLSPDGTLAAVEVRTNNTYDLWLYDVSRGTRTRLTFDGRSRFPRWAPDGSGILFRLDGAGSSELWWTSASGGVSRPLLSEPNTYFHSGAWAPGGTSVAVQRFNETTGWDIYLLSLPDGNARPLLATKANETSPLFSPDSEWLAYVSDESGETEVYLLSMLQGGRRVQLSKNDGDLPLWSRAGDELFYFNRGSIDAVKFASKAPLRISEPQRLFGAADFRFDRGWDVDSSGTHFLVLEQPVSSAASGRIQVILDWLGKYQR